MAHFKKIIIKERTLQNIIFVEKTLSSFIMQLILGSKSPRRQELLKGLDIPFDIVAKDVEEVFPEDLALKEIPSYLSKLKASAYSNEIEDGKIVLTADTIVVLENKILLKPKDLKDASNMLNLLSGKKHEVITGVCLKSKSFEDVFSNTSLVHFKHLSKTEIDYYLEKYKPLDKAGSYGIQEWIGYVGIEKIEGCFFNVMGLPVRLVYEKLKAQNLI